MKMKNQRLLIILCILVLATGSLAADNAHTIQSVRGIATALDHLTVLEYDEAVTQAAIGSAAYEVERQDNKVFIKPLKTGVSTNLFVWTASKQHYTYELSVGDAARMDAEIHVATRSAPQLDNTAEVSKVSEMAVSQALTGIREVDASAVKTSKGKIGIRFEEIVNTDKTLYIRYSVENRKAVPYQFAAPLLYQLKIEHPAVSLISLKGKQVDPRMVVKNPDEARVLVATIDNSAEEDVIAPGDRKEGLLAIPKTADLSAPTVLQVVLPDNVQAMIVL
jgi:Conjugal transfer protein